MHANSTSDSFVEEATTLEQIASVIVHETTHAVLERRGIAYDEARRHRIEAICLRRQLHFVSKLAGGEAEQESVKLSLDYYGDNPEFFSDVNMGQRFHDGSVETLRWLGVPNCLVALISKVAEPAASIQRVADNGGRIVELYAIAGRCARRNERIWRTASGTRSFGSFQGKMLTSAFGASIALSMATA